MNILLIIHFKDGQEYIIYINAKCILECNDKRIKFVNSEGKISYYLLDEIDYFEIKQEPY